MKKLENVKRARQEKASNFSIIAVSNCVMFPWRLIAILEQADPSFQDLFYPGKYRCSLDNRIVRAIEEHWPAYFPTQKECRGASWSLTISENEPLYQPNSKSLQKLADWKKSIKGTIAEIRAYQADISWKRFLEICRSVPRLHPLLDDFKPLSEFFLQEESLWPKYGGKPITQETYFRGHMQALCVPGSPYHQAEPDRLKFLNSNNQVMAKIRMIGLMRQLFDLPLMVLAILQECASRSPYARFWLPIQNHVTAIVKTPSPLTFRKTWLEHAMQISGAKTKSGKSVPRKWATLLVDKMDADLTAINAKGVEVHHWLHGTKQPSMESIRHAGRVFFSTQKLTAIQAETGNDYWLFSWMVTLWLEKHFAEITDEFKDESREIQNYYGRFFHYLEFFALSQKARGWRA